MNNENKSALCSIKPYEYRMSIIGDAAAFGFGVAAAIGLVIAIIVAFKSHEIGAAGVVFMLFTVLIGTIITIIRFNSSGKFESAAYGAVGGSFSVMSGMSLAEVGDSCTGTFAGLGIVGGFIAIFIAALKTLFMMIEFPIMFVYTLVFFLLEKCGVNFSHGVAKFFDWLVSVGCFFIVVYLGIKFLQAI